MSWETFSIDTYFDGDMTKINFSQLRNEILEEPSISKVCLDSGRLDNLLKLKFDSALSNDEKTKLIELITNHVPIPTPIISNAILDPVTNLIKHQIDNKEYLYVGIQPQEIIISKSDQNQYSTIKEAIESSDLPNRIFIVYPGIYYEDNPLILPDGCIIKGTGNPQTTVIRPNDPNSDLFIMGRITSLSEITIENVINARAVYFDGSQSLEKTEFSGVIKCMFTDCYIAIETDGKNTQNPALVDTMYCNQILIKCTNINGLRGISVVNSGCLIATSVQILGGIPTQESPNGFPYIYSVYCSGVLSNLSLTTFSSWLNATAIFIDDNAIIDCTMVTLKYNSTAICVGENGNSSFTGDSINILNSYLYDLDIQSEDSIVDFTARNLDGTKVNNPNSVKINVNYNDLKYGRRGQTLVGNISIGNPREPSKMNIGEGQYADEGVVVFTNSYLDSGEWVDHTAAATTISCPSFNLFSGTSTGNCLYVGSDNVIPGMKVDVLTEVQVVVSNSSVVYEYWKGSEWKEFSIMQTEASAPYYTKLDSFISTLGKFHIRFGISSRSDIVKTILNGAEKYWIRLRLLEDLPNLPVSKYLKVHINHTAINSDGFTEYFGNARPIKTLISSVNQFTTADGEFPDHIAYLSKGIKAPLLASVFSSGQVRNMGTLLVIPSDMDVSFPIKMHIGFTILTTASSPNNKVSWKIKYGTSLSRDTIYATSISAPDTSQNEITKSFITTVSDLIDYREEIMLPVSHISQNPENGEEVIIWMTLERDASGVDPEDTYPGHVALTFVKGKYVAWNNGFHLSTY